MGFLSDQARKTFDRRRTRTYVPDWFQPVSYVVVGAVAVVVLLIGLAQARGGDAEVSAGPVPGEPVGEVLLDVPTPEVLPSAPSTDSAAPAPSKGGEKTVTVAVQGGGSVELPLAALLVGQKAARALFTGDFSGVPLAEGTVAPLALEQWRDPAVGNVRSVLVFPDGSFNAAFPVDPDGPGPELERILDVTVTPAGAGWALLPVP